MFHFIKRTLKLLIYYFTKLFSLFGRMSDKSQEKMKPEKESDAIVPDAEQSGTKTKAQLRAERREKQEAQRAAKAQREKDGTPKLKGGQQHNKTTKKDTPKKEASSESKVAPSLSKEKIPNESPAQTTAQDCQISTDQQASAENPPSTTQSSLNRAVSESDPPEERFNKTKKHVIVTQLKALAYACEKDSVCDTAQCIELLKILQDMINKYENPKNRGDPIRDIDFNLRDYLSVLKMYTPLSNGMGNAVRYLKKNMMELANSPNANNETQIKSTLSNSIKQFISEKIVLASKAISEKCLPLITENSVILTVGLSNIICEALVNAKKEGRTFRVILVDSGPKFHARTMLTRLLEEKIQCTYILCNAIPYVMSEVSKVFVGAHSLLANGSVVGQAGTTMVALLAKDFNVPVFACCENYKLSEKVQMHAIGSDTGRQYFPTSGPLMDWKNHENITMLDFTSEVTPFDLITNVVTEQLVIPNTAAPALLRILHDDTRKMM